MEESASVKFNDMDENDKAANLGFTLGVLGVFFFISIFVIPIIIRIGTPIIFAVLASGLFFSLKSMRSSKNWKSTSGAILSTVGLVAVTLLIIRLFLQPHMSIYRYFLFHNYEFILIFTFLVSLFATYFFEHILQRKVSLLASFSFLALPMNPYLIDKVARHFEWHWIGRGNSYYWGFLFALLSCITGFAAIKMIRKSQGSVLGFNFGAIGALIGTLAAGAWAMFFFSFLLNMSLIK